MNFREIIISSLIFFVGIGTVFAQENAIVTIIPPKPMAVAKGQITQLTVTAKIKKGFHIQANPAADEFLIPTTLTIQAGEGIIPDKPVYPSGHRYRLKGSTEDLLTYEGEVIIRLPVQVMESAPAGNASVTGKLKYQPCDDRKCMFPRSVPVNIPVQIVNPQK
jgi:DsbC/DsbD-like thiol-disulfide interchange protein